MISQLATKRKTVIKLRQEASEFKAQVRRELLEAKTKGIKLDPQSQAKKELDIFNRKEELATRIRKVTDEIKTIRESSKPTKETPQASHTHEAQETPQELLELFDSITRELESIKTG